MKEKQLVPKMRFNNFNENWHVNKLKNIATFSKGKGYSKNDITEQGTELLLYGSLYTSYKTIINTMKTYTTLKENSIISTGKEVVVPSSGETKEDIARASAIDKSGIIIGGDLNIIQPRKELNTVFLALEISHGSSQKELIKRAQGSSVVHLYNDDLKEVLIFYPTINEQQKIGEFFKVLDERIANQERKISKVKALKEAYLTEMFPQEGETVPKRRFKGFEGEWKEICLRDVGNEYYGGGTPRTSIACYWNGNIPWIQSSDIKENHVWIKQAKNSITQEGLQKSATKLIPANSIAVVTRVGVGKLAFIPFEYTTSQDFLSISNLNLFHEFAVYAMYKLLEKEKKSVQGTSIKGVTNDELLALKLCVPQNKNEQQKIGAFFKNLDDQIRAEEAKLEKLKKMKEAYLEEMFV